MTEHPDIAIVTTAKSAFEADVIAGVLREANIPVYVAGSLLQDPASISEITANVLHVKIQVPSDQLEAARAALQAADASAKLLDRDDFDPGDPVE